MSAQQILKDAQERMPIKRIRTLLICHDGAELDQKGLAGWLASFSDLVGVVVLREKPRRMRRRIQKEIERIGALRFLDVIAFRLYHYVFLARSEREWRRRKLEELSHIYPEPVDVRSLFTHSPNSPEAQEFIRQCKPDIVLARCKTLLNEKVFSIPSKGTFVMHPGICPEYRNAHGCFWALANGDLNKVGMTLLRIDTGIDTGPVYGYYSYNYDQAHESPMIIQYRVVLENLHALQKKLIEIHNDEATPLDTSGRESSTWGQPWLSSYLKMRRRARRNENESHFSHVS